MALLYFSSVKSICCDILANLATSTFITSNRHCSHTIFKGLNLFPLANLFFSLLNQFVVDKIQFHCVAVFQIKLIFFPPRKKKHKWKKKSINRSSYLLSYKFHSCSFAANYTYDMIFFFFTHISNHITFAST